MADRKRKVRKDRGPKLTREEKLLQGLMTQRAENDIFVVKEVQGRGRGLFLRTEILRKDSFVLEYKGDIISEAVARYRERIYARNNEGCFIMSFAYEGTKLAIDATRHFESYARLLNHSREPNIRFFRPILVDLNGRGLPRIASYALRDIYKGEEIVIDYGVRDGHIAWLRNRKIGFVADVDSDSSDSVDADNSRVDGQVSEKVSSVNPSPDDDVSSDVTSTEVLTLTRTDRQIGQISEWNNVRQDNSSLSLSGVCGIRFKRMVPDKHIKTYLAVVEDIGVPQKIMRIIENTAKKGKLRSDAESIVCISTSSSNTSKLSEKKLYKTTLTSCRKNAFSSQSSKALGRTSNIKLPCNKTPDSIHKVLEWQLTSPQDSTMDMQSTMGIQIISIQSLNDSPCVEENSNIDHSPTYRQQSSSAFQAHEISASIHPNHGSLFDRKLHNFHENDQPSVSTTSHLPPLTITKNNIEELVVNLDTSESDDKSESSGFSCFSLNMANKGPLPSLGEESLKKKTVSMEPADVYVVSDDECVPQTDDSKQQLKCLSQIDLTKEKCNTVESSSSECELVYTAEDEECEIIWSELQVPSSEQGKLANNWPARRPVGFSSPSAQQKVAVIKPYVSPCASGITQGDTVAMTESELEQLKVIFHQHIFSNKSTSSFQQVQQAIYSNWNFFSVLINRGVSIDQIRTTVNNLFKKT